ncbi:uncharacterized protein [Panulirus ornatus]|uniref:uncharacterized protein isoform X2 n=1 Tax=Panulirus ornatus TaxID=150431 RepID=UPI003A885F64
MSGNEIPADDLRRRTEGEDHLHDNLQSTGQQHWSAVYIKEELMSSPEEAQNTNGLIDPLKVVKQEVGVVNELARSSDLNMPPMTRLHTTDSTQYNGLLYMDDKTVNGYNSIDNLHYPNVTHNTQPSTSSGSAYRDSPSCPTSISPSNGNNISPTTHPPPSPSPFFSIHSNGHYPSPSPANYTSTSPVGQTPTSPIPYNSGNTTTGPASSSRAVNVSPVSPEPCVSIIFGAQASKDPNSTIPQSSGSAPLSTFNPVTELIIPDAYFHESMQQQGPSAYHSVPVPQGQSSDCFSQGPMASTNVEGKTSTYHTPSPTNSSPLVRQVSAGPSGGSPSQKRRSASCSSAYNNSRAGLIRNGRKRYGSQVSSLAPYSIEGTMLPLYTPPHNKYILPSTLASANEPLLSFNQTHLPSPYSNTETFPPLSQPQRSSLYSPPPYTLPKTEENSSFPPYILPPSNKITLTGDSSPQTYTHLGPQSYMTNSTPPSLSNQPDFPLYTNAPPVTFSGTSQLSVHSQMSSHSSSSSPVLPPFTSINSAPPVASTSSLALNQDSGNQVIELVNGDVTSNTLFWGDNSNTNIAAGTSDQNATRRTPSRIFSCALQATCSRCGVRFASSGHLKRHLQSHGSNRRFKCHLCDCAYSRQDNLKKHLLAAHGVSQIRNN